MSLVTFLLQVSPFCAIFFLYLSWNQWRLSRPPRVWKKNSMFNSLAVQYCSDYLGQMYSPTVWAFSPLIHTLYFARWPQMSYAVKIEHLEVSDGGIVGILWPRDSSQCRDIQLTTQSPIVLFITNPLVQDKSFYPYIEVAFQGGYRPAVFIHKESDMLSKLPHLLKRSHEANSNNSNSGNRTGLYVGEVVDYLRHKYPESLCYVVGLSYGNATVFQYLTSDANSRGISGAACISPAWRKGQTAVTVSKNIQNRVSDGAPNRGPKVVTVESNSSQINPSQNWKSDIQGRFYCGRPPEIKIESLDHLTVMPNETFTRFRRLLVPTIVLYSKDDPMLNAEERGRLAAMWRYSELLLVVETTSGGHVGFLQDFHPQSWSANLVFQYFDAVGKFRDATVAKSINGHTTYNGLSI
eukprot:gene6957-7739_t